MSEFVLYKLGWKSGNNCEYNQHYHQNNQTEPIKDIKST